MVWFLKKPLKKKEQKAEQVEKKEEQIKEKTDKIEEKEHPLSIDVDEIFKRSEDNFEEIIDALGNLKINSVEKEFKKLPEDNQKSKNNLKELFKFGRNKIFCSKCGKIIAEKSDLEKTDEGGSKEKNFNKVKIIIKIEPKTKKPGYKLTKFVISSHLCDDCLKEFFSKIDSGFEYLDDVFKFFRKKF